MRKLRILALVHRSLVPPADANADDSETSDWKTEYDVITTLRQLGHQVVPLGVDDHLEVVRQAIEKHKPHICFNLLEEFAGRSAFDQNVVSYLELLGVPYTGCNPQGLILARDKALTKKLLRFHHIPVPDFAVCRLGRKARRPARLGFPLIVKSVDEEASLGISQASIVESDEELVARVAEIHEELVTDALIESYVDGRELYVALLGNSRLTVFPTWELLFEKMPDGARNIATARVKWDVPFQKKHGITSSLAADLPDDVNVKLPRLAKKIFRVLKLTGYARIDLRLTPEGKFYVLEANPNPQLAFGEDLAESAEADGLSYPGLLNRILQLGLRAHKARDRA